METGITFNANDNTQSAISGIIAGLTGMGAIGATAFQGMLQSVTNVSQRIGAFAWEITQLGATAEAMQGKFDMVFRSLAGDVTKQLVDFGQAAGRSKYELMRMAAEFQDTLVPMGFARDEAAEMSVGLTKLAIDLASFNDISDQEAFVRLQGGLIGNTENLLKFGVIANVAQLEQFALNNELWDGVGVLDPLTKATVIYQMTIAQTADAQNDAILTAWQFNNTMKALEAVFSELKTEMGSRLVPEFGNFLNIFKSFIPGVQQVGAGLAGVFANLMSTVHRFASGFIQSFTGLNFNQITKESKSWGHDLIIQFARGMAEATKYVIQVLQYIGDIITYWLIPHSPPKILPDIDTWGADTMMEYIKGFGEADLSLFDNIANQVSAYIKQAMPDEDELDKLDINQKITLSRQVIAENIKAVDDYKTAYFDAMLQNSEMSKYFATNIQDLSYYSNLMLKDYQSGVIGNIAPTQEWQAQVELAVANISASAGGLSPAFEDYLEVLFNSEYATEQVRVAQEELNAVTQHFSELLAPLNKELAEINDAKEAIRNQQRLEQLQSILTDETKTAQEKELANLEIRGIQIQEQIKNVEKEQDLASSIAQQKLNAAQEQQQKFQEELKIKQQILGVGQEQNSLLKEQEGILDSIQEKMEKMSDSMGKAAKGLGEGANQVKEAMQDLTDWGKAPPAISVFEETFTEIDGIFEELQPMSEQLGNTWGEIGQTINEYVVVKGLKFFYNTLIDIKTDFDELIRKVSIFQTLMTSDSVVQKLENIGTKIGFIINSFASGDLSKLFSSLEEGLPGIESNLNGFLDDFGRNFKAVFGVDISYQVQSVKEIFGTMFDSIVPTLQKVKNGFDSISNTVGDFFRDKLAKNSPVLQGIQQKFEKLYEIFNRSGWKIFASIFELIGGVIAGIVTTAFTIFVGLVEGGLVVFDGFLRILTISMETLERGAENWQKMTDIISKLFEAIGAGDFSGIVEQLFLLQMVLFDNFSMSMGALVEIIWTVIKTANDAIMAFFVSIVDTGLTILFGFNLQDVINIWTIIIDGWVNNFNKAVDSAREWFGDVWEKIKSTFWSGIAYITNVGEIWKNNFSSLLTIFGQLWDLAKEKLLQWGIWFLGKVYEWKIYLEENFEYAIQTILTNISSAWETLKTYLIEYGVWFYDLIAGFVVWITDFGTAFVQYLTDIYNNITSVQTAFQMAKKIIQDAMNGAGIVLNTFKNTLVGIYNEHIAPILTELSLTFYNLWDDLKQYFYDIGMWIIGMKDNFIMAVNAIMEKIAPLLEAIGLLDGASQGQTGGETGSGGNPRASTASDSMNLNTQSMRETLPTVRRAMTENDVKQLISQKTTHQTWNITFNQQNVEKRSPLEDMQLVKTFMGS